MLFSRGQAEVAKIFIHEYINLCTAWMALYRYFPPKNSTMLTSQAIKDADEVVKKLEIFQQHMKKGHGIVPLRSRNYRCKNRKNFILEAIFEDS